MKSMKTFKVIDLFSGAGGMSFGFHKHPVFEIVAAADAEHGKPSSGFGKLQCNSTYRKNIGISPIGIDLSKVSTMELRSALGITEELKIHVLSTCPPCTGFSRANPKNHQVDDMRNSLVRKSAEFAVTLGVDVVVMENARELIQGNFKYHYEWFREYLEDNGYDVFGKVYLLRDFGLPQIRERAIVIATKHSSPLHNLESLWDGWTVRDEALTVKRAFSKIDKKATGVNVYPDFSSEIVKKRIQAIPKDGGSWIELIGRPDVDSLLTPSMKRIIEKKRIGSYPDVYGRMAWLKPAPTIKRECAHIGNGRYAHPVDDRLCTVREMAILQGFPNDFVVNGAAISNLYRHIGDAVPPLISYQIAHICSWILTGNQPKVTDILLDGTNLKEDDIVRKDKKDFCDA